MPKILSQTKKIAALTLSERATMFGLLSLEFLGMRREDFIHDLEEKDVVVLLRRESREGEIVGFSTLMIFDLQIDGRKVKAIFSGDTTVLPEFRSSSGIGVEIIRYFMKALREFSDCEIYYVLISKGWRTYKVLPYLFKRFAPKHDSALSNREKDVIDAFGRAKYPREYDSDKGIIIFSKETQRLIPGSIDAVPPKNPDEHIKFFLKKNPTYLSGTELVCVGLVKVENFAPPLMRVLKISKEKP